MNRQSSLRNLLNQCTAALLLISIGAGTLSAQTARKAGQPAKTPVKTGWSGVITYQKTLQEDFSSDEKLMGRIDERERIKHHNTRRYTYTGKMVVNDFAGTGRATTSAQVNFRDAETQKTTQTELTNCHAFDPERLIKAESVDRKTTVGSGSGEAYSYSLSTDGISFHLGFTLPEIQGTYTHDFSSTYSNLCPDSTRKPSASTNTNDARIERGGAEIDGTVDPKNPDVIEGSKTWSDGPKSFSHTVTWRLRRKPQPLMITDIRFEQPIYPSPNDWQEIPQNAWAVDGNQVKVIATIANLGATDKTASVNFKELKENIALPNGPVSATIPANGQKDVELVWDTSGYAWRQSGADVVPEMSRQVEVTIPDDSMQKDLTVIPKPVVVVWGFWQSGEAIDKFHNYFKAVSEKWHAWASRTDFTKTSTDNADALDNSVRDIQKNQNAWHVDMVAIQNGGLAGRVYVNSKMPTQFDGRPTATHLVLAAVPNLGTPCATGLYGLSFRINTFNLDAVGELSPESMKRFNLLVNNTNGTKFAALAGDSRESTCQADSVHGDGFSPVKSSIWRTKTNFVSRVSVNTRDFMGEVSHFRQIYKWLAVPPKGDHNPDPSTLAGLFQNEYPNYAFDADLPTGRHYGAMFEAGKPADGDDPRPDLATVAKLAPRQTAEIEVPVRSGSRFSLVLFGSPDVSATLIDEKGEVLGQNLAGSPESGEIFRSIMVKKPFQAAKWKLRLENRQQMPTEIAVTGFVDFSWNDN
jgi:hypothetical protein